MNTYQIPDPIPPAVKAMILAPLPALPPIFQAIDRLAPLWRLPVVPGLLEFNELLKKVANNVRT